MSHAYLTVDEVSAQWGITPQAARLRLARENLPCFLVGRLLRVEARALDVSAPDAVPSDPEVSLEELAELWRVSPRTIQRLITAGHLLTRAEGGAVLVSRRAVLRYLLDHGRGEDR